MFRECQCSAWLKLSSITGDNVVSLFSEILFKENNEMCNEKWIRVKILYLHDEIFYFDLLFAAGDRERSECGA